MKLRILYKHNRYIIQKTFLLPFLWENAIHYTDNLCDYTNLFNQGRFSKFYRKEKDAESALKDVIKMYNEYKGIRKTKVVKTINLSNDIDQFEEFL